MPETTHDEGTMPIPSCIPTAGGLYPRASHGALDRLTPKVIGRVRL